MNYLFRQFTWVSLIWLGITSSVFAKTSLSIEPYLGYSQFAFKSAGSEDSKWGAVLGGKGGFEVSRDVVFAADFQFGGPYLLEDNDNEFLNFLWGAGLGLSGRNLRLWLGYYFSNTLEDVERNIKYLGKAVKVSLGARFESKLSVNVEYLVEQFDEYQGSSFFGSGDVNIDANILMFSISAPLEIK